jgi:hypothetical protein
VWATAQDVKDRWIGGEPPAEDQQIVTLIGDAEDIILGEFPTIGEQIDAGEVPGGRVQRVVARMVIRVLRNPEGLRQVQETTGPFTGSQTYGGDHPGELYLTDDDRRDLAGGKARGKAYTLSTVPAGWR